MKNILFAWDHKGGKGPWGKGPQKGARPSGNASQKESQPDIEQMIRHAQNRLGRTMNGGRGNNGGGNGGGLGLSSRMISLMAMGAGVLWLASGFYIVDPSERGVVLRFGKHVETTSPGLNYRLPWPIEAVYKPAVERENRIEVGFRSTAGVNPVAQMLNRRAVGGLSGYASAAELDNESLMLTGDENIVDLDFSVRWKIADPENYLFNVASPDAMIKDVAESAMREIIGKRPIDDALTANKAEIELAARDLIQEIVDAYEAGIQINAVELQQVNPPVQVIDAYKDVQAARADAEKLQNEAIGYANNIVPRARGEGARILQEAEGYKQAKVADAQGRAQRFNDQLREYQRAQTVTEQRLYIEAMEDVLKKSNVIVLGGESARGVLPYLPLNNAGQVKGGR